MARPKTYLPEDTTRKCIGECGETYPLTSEHFGRNKQAPQGWVTRCKTCFNIRRVAKRNAREAKMTPTEFDAMRVKQRATQAKSRNKVRSPEDAAARKHKKWLRSGAPALLKKVLHYAFVARMCVPSELTDRDKRDMTPEQIARPRLKVGSFWPDFYETVMGALEDAYGVTRSSTWDEGAPLRDSETYQLLEKMNTDVVEWSLDINLRNRLKEDSDQLRALEPEDLEFVKTYKPRSYYRDDLYLIAPRDRDSFFSDTKPLTDEQIKRRDYEFKILGLVVMMLGVEQSSEYETRIERKHRMQDLLRSTEHAQEALDAHPDQELIQKITEQYTTSITSGPIESIDGPEVADYLEDSDPEARMIDAREEEL